MTFSKLNTGHSTFQGIFYLLFKCLISYPGTVCHSIKQQCLFYFFSFFFYRHFCYTFLSLYSISLFFLILTPFYHRFQKTAKPNVLYFFPKPEFMSLTLFLSCATNKLVSYISLLLWNTMVKISLFTIDHFTFQKRNQSFLIVSFITRFHFYSL